jgi:hypothetical protein
MLMPHFHVSLMASPTLHFWRSCWFNVDTIPPANIDPWSLESLAARI